MQFGLFAGAKVGTAAADSGMSVDSLGLQHFVDYVLHAEAQGFSHIFMVEHHFTGAQQVSSSLGLLTYLAGRTTKIRLGTAVIVLPWHNPALLAETVAVLDILSKGRFDFGIGKGYKKVEFDAFCIPFEEASERFEECFAFLRKAWTSKERFSWDGKYHKYHNVEVEPSPWQKPHPPFWMAANSAESIRRAAREDVNLLLDQVATIDGVIERLDIYREEKTRLGIAYDPAQVAVTRALRLIPDEAERAAWLKFYAGALDAAGVLKFGPAEGEEGKRRYIESDAPLIGSEEQICGQLERLQAGGVEIVLMVDVTGSHDTLDVFGERIIPRFASVTAPAARATLAAA